MYRDHPRIRGTNALRTEYSIIEAGSSPHTRDKSKVRVGLPLDLGIIPAYAGQISLMDLQMAQKQDHPRIRGTNKPLSSSSVHS